MLAAGFFTVAVSASCPVQAQTLAHKNWAGSGLTVQPWWRGASLYQLDPLTFQDGDGNGFGDLRGIASRLDYLQSLGLDALVLSPFQLQSPDRSQPAPRTGTEGAQPFDPTYGTDDDFARLLAEASAHGLRIVVDLPFDTAHGAQETLGAARFWMTRGVAGLRLAPAASAEPLAPEQERTRLHELRLLCAQYPGTRVLLLAGRALEQESDRSHLGASATRPVQAGKQGKASRRPRTGARRHAGVSSAATQSQAKGASARADQERTAEGAPVLVEDLAPAGWNLAATANTGAPGAFGGADVYARNAAALWMATLRPRSSAHAQVFAPQPPVALLATDVPERPRSWGRLGDGTHDAALARVQAALLVLGTADPVLLYGQELGIRSDPGDRAPDPIPMQWTGSPGTPGSFTSGVPWVPMGPSTATANVQLEEADPGSLLNLYRHLLALRHTQPALHSGALALLSLPQPGLVAFVRRVPADAEALSAPVVVLANLSAQAVMVSVAAQLAGLGIRGAGGGLHTLFATDAASAAGPVPLHGIAVPAFGIYVGSVKPPAGLEGVMPPPRASRKAH